MAAEKREYSTCCKICCLCSCCCCLAWFFLGAAIGIIFATATEPEVDVKHAYFRDASVTADRVVFHMDVEIWVNNPNGWPITGKLEKLVADAWSLKNITREGGNDKQPVYLGQGVLKEPFELKTNSEGTFTVLVMVNVIRPDSVKLAPRFRDDCCIHGNSTSLRVKLLEGVVNLGGSSIELPMIEMDDLPVPCADMFEPNVCRGMKASAGAGSGAGATSQGNLLR